MACSKFSGRSHPCPPKLHGIFVGKDIGSDWPSCREFPQPLIEKKKTLHALGKTQAVLWLPLQFSCSYSEGVVAQNLLMNSLQDQWVGNCVRLDQG